MQGKFSPFWCTTELNHNTVRFLGKKFLRTYRGKITSRNIPYEIRLLNKKGHWINVLLKVLPRKKIALPNKTNPKMKYDRILELV